MSREPARRFSFRPRLRYPAGMGDREGTPLLVAPVGFVVEDDGRAEEPGDYRSAAPRATSLRITWPSGSRAKAIPLFVFCTFWFGFLAFWYANASRSNAPLLMFVFPLLHVGAGLALLHGALVMLLNTTRLSVAGGVLEVRSGPVPVRGNVRLDAGRIRQLFVTRKEHKGQRTGTTTSFAVEAVVDGGSRLVVVRGLEEADAALYLEAALEQNLRIAAQPVVGEIAR